MRVEVDDELCAGYGTCAHHAPEVFKLDDSLYAYVEEDGEVPGAEEHLVRRAIADCPMRAIIQIEPR